MRLLYLDWPHLPLRLELERRPVTAELIVLGGQAWDPGVVLDCSPAAAALGVRRGQPLGSAHNLVPEAVFLPVDRDHLAASMEAALRRIGELAPAVEGTTDPDDPAFGRILVGIEGLERLWGSEPELVARAVALLAPILPGSPRAGVGNTRFGAQVAAIAGVRAAAGTEAGEGQGAHGSIPAGDRTAEAAYLAPLPIGLLPADPETRERFRLFGLTRIGELAALDRSAVVARFGTPGGELHDLARGLDGRPLRPRRPVERLRAEAQLEPPVDTLEPLRFVLRHLCGALCEQLAARGAGAARATLDLVPERGDPVRYEQALPEPAAASELLERLLMARLEADPPAGAVERLSLELDGAAPAAGQQLGLFTPQLARAARLDWQLAALAIRFGPDRLLQARLLDPDASVALDRFAWGAAGPTLGDAA
ncbi:MAG: DNA polymerase Y family protein [Chloroflexota bacterium]